MFSEQRNSLSPKSGNEIQHNMLAHTEIKEIRCTTTPKYYPQNKKTVVYTIVMEVDHEPIECNYRFQDFKSWKKKLLNVLQCGHHCSGCCPWLYMFIESEFPRNHYFHSSSNPTVSAERARQLRSLIETLLGIYKKNAQHDCVILHKSLTEVVADFLLAKAPLTVLRASSSSSLSSDENEEHGFQCICGAHDSTKSITTLKCGHMFHDDCILERLNEDLSCPTCGFHY